jgi:hypothetical protein
LFSFKIGKKKKTGFIKNTFMSLLVLLVQFDF